MNEHPFPWKPFLPDADTHAYILDANGDQVIRTTADKLGVAAHIVACVNACRGFSTESLSKAPSGYLHHLAQLVKSSEYTESEGGEL